MPRPAGAPGDDKKDEERRRKEKKKKEKKDREDKERKDRSAQLLEGAPDPNHKKHKKSEVHQAVGDADADPNRKEKTKKKKKKHPVRDLPKEQGIKLVSEYKDGDVPHSKIDPTVHTKKKSKTNKKKKSKDAASPDKTDEEKDKKEKSKSKDKKKKEKKDKDKKEKLDLSDDPYAGDTFADNLMKEGKAKPGKPDAAGSGSKKKKKSKDSDKRKKAKKDKSNEKPSDEKAGSVDGVPTSTTALAPGMPTPAPPLPPAPPPAAARSPTLGHIAIAPSTDPGAGAAARNMSMTATGNSGDKTPERQRKVKTAPKQSVIVRSTPCAALPPPAVGSAQMPYPSQYSVDLNMDEILRVGFVLERHGMTLEKKESFNWLAMHRTHYDTDPLEFAAYLNTAVGDLILSKSLCKDALTTLLYASVINHDEFFRLSDLMKHSRQPLTIGQVALWLKENAAIRSKNPLF